MENFGPAPFPVITQPHRNLTRFEYTIKHAGRSPGGYYEIPIALCSDIHIDNPDCLRDQYLHYLQTAVDMNAPVCCFGDYLCMMQGRNDRRGSKGKIRPENQKDDHFGSIIEEEIERMRPYASHLAMFSQGNHETAIIRHNEIDILKRIVTGWKDRFDSPVQYGAYSGRIHVDVKLFDTRSQKIKNSNSVIIYYHHSPGSGGVVTRGHLAPQRMIAKAEADIYVTGHIHQGWEERIPRDEYSFKTKEPRIVTKWFVCLPAFKDEYKDGRGGYVIEKNYGPTNLGAAFLMLKFNPRDGFLDEGMHSTEIKWYHAKGKYYGQRREA